MAQKMSRSVSLLDYKVEQAGFFLEKLSAAKESFVGTQCYSDAFVSACRSITFAMQAAAPRLMMGRWVIEALPLRKIPRSVRS